MRVYDIAKWNELCIVFGYIFMAAQIFLAFFAFIVYNFIKTGAGSLPMLQFNRF